MSTQEQVELRDKIVEAMKISAQMLVAKKKALGQSVVIMEDGIIKTIQF